MRRTRFLLTVVITIAAVTLLFWIVLHQISSVWLDVALRPEVRTALEQSMEDQKALRGHDPARRAELRKRFDETQKLLNRIDVLRMNRQAMLRRFELALILLFAIAAAAAPVLLWIRYRRAQERERREYLERVTSLQETARRHAHEIKGPLTAARLEMERYADLVRNGAPEPELVRAQDDGVETRNREARGRRGLGRLHRRLRRGPHLLRAAKTADRHQGRPAGLARSGQRCRAPLPHHAHDRPGGGRRL